MGDLQVVGSTWSGSGSTARRFVAVALQCEPTARAEPDYGEDVEVVLESLTDFRGLLRTGQLTDLGAAYFALDHLGELA